jgi:hypothetical protein
MSTTPGIPLPAHLAGPLNQFDWMNPFGDETVGLSPRSIMQGQPPAFSWWHQRAHKAPPQTPMPIPIYVQGPVYDRGADAFAPQFGKLLQNPIGAGIHASYKLPVIAGPGARYQFGAIWFGVQSIPTSVQINPTVPIETINALLATSHVSAAYLTTG